ncbi:MAG: ABC transporter substrate-binding protein [Thiogranum sp.]|nr:ABC transporter substrate-binding protein [Thiogranum sp.]
MRGPAFFMLMMLAFAGVAATPAPEQLIREQAGNLLAHIAVEQDGENLENLVAEIIAPHVDFELFSKLVLGKHRRSLSAAQQQRFRNGMTHLVIKTYATALSGTSKLEIEYQGLQENKNPDRVVVLTVVSSSGNPPVRIDYKLHRRDNIWKVYDVAIEGVSMAINYRTVIAERSSLEGIDAAIDSLSERPVTLAAQ